MLSESARWYNFLFPSWTLWWIFQCSPFWPVRILMIKMMQQFFFSCCFRPHPQALVYPGFIPYRHSMEVAYPLSEALLGKISLKMPPRRRSLNLYLGKTQIMQTRLNAAASLFQLCPQTSHLQIPGSSGTSIVCFHRKLSAGSTDTLLSGLQVKGKAPHLLRWGSGLEIHSAEAFLSKITLHIPYLLLLYLLYLSYGKIQICPKSLSSTQQSNSSLWNLTPFLRGYHS